MSRSDIVFTMAIAVISIGAGLLLGKEAGVVCLVLGVAGIILWHELRREEHGETEVNTLFGAATPISVNAPSPTAATLYGESPLEIVFDSSNPARRFWSMESPKDDHGVRLPGAFWEHRVEIRNNSMKTLKNVSVTTERLGPMPERPYDSVFDKIKKTTCDLKPGCSELVPIIRWPIPKKQAGMLAGPSAWRYGPIKIIASADDTLPSVRIFQFNYDTDQMLFDKVPSDTSITKADTDSPALPPKPNLHLCGSINPAIIFDEQSKEWRQSLEKYALLAYVLEFRNDPLPGKKVADAHIRVQLTYKSRPDLPQITIGPLAWIGTAGSTKEIGVAEAGELIIARRVSEDRVTWWQFAQAPSSSYELLNVPSRDFTFTLRLINVLDGSCGPEFEGKWCWPESEARLAGILPEIEWQGLSSNKYFKF